MNWWLEWMPRFVRRELILRALAKRLDRKLDAALSAATAAATGARQTSESKKIWERFARISARRRRVMTRLGREVL